MARIYRVVEQVARVAYKRSNRTPRLKIIQASREMWAVALPDGWIILSKGAVDICYRDASKDEGDAHMAFVWNHELAPLARNDFWLRVAPGTDLTRYPRRRKVLDGYVVMLVLRVGSLGTLQAMNGKLDEPLC